MTSETERQAASRSAKLDRAAALCKTATDEAALAQQLATEKPAQDAAWRSVTASMEAVNTLLSIGAVSPFGTHGKPADGLDLSGLTLLDTSDSRDLLAALERAQEIAERIDASRGRALPSSISLQHGESRGTDLAESISEIALRLRVDVFGPAGKE